MRILYMCFLYTICMMNGCPISYETQYIEDPQLKTLLRMTNDVVGNITQQLRESNNEYEANQSV